ncbi:GNAT family N-acetyltransferase [Halocatena salina]|uniref:GNAT family N-acetyltransferase n=1 Tax=Halocatena salina TaxID=2934340 RepID=A0A8T9ZYZ7_9EURY|nr:GNAT family N-acetyltransferase [Halocatena salina]UPM41960.1 GNAT family N-acetyltransferase [Halocatena salina]
MILDRLWRLTRNEYGRAVYEALARRGVKGSLLYVYARSLHDGDDSDHTPDGITIDARRKRDLDADISERAFQHLDSTDIVVFARSDGQLLGHVVLSCTRPVYVAAIETTVGEASNTAYLWRLHVDPAHRQRGIGTALVAHARREAARADGPTTITALVAIDNVPSRTLFETNGFDRQTLIVYGKAFGWTHKTRWALSDAGTD